TNSVSNCGIDGLIRSSNWNPVSCSMRFRTGVQSVYRSVAPNCGTTAMVYRDAAWVPPANAHAMSTAPSDRPTVLIQHFILAPVVFFWSSACMDQRIQDSHTELALECTDGVWARPPP